MKRYLFLFSLIVLALSCVLLTACGGDTPEDTTAPATSAPATSAPAASSAPATSAPVTSAPATSAPDVTTAPPTTSAPATSAPAPAMTFVGKTVTYDGENHAVAVEGDLPAGTTVLYSVNGATAAATYELRTVGTYEIVATVTLPEGYEAADSMTCTVVINQATVNMSAVAFPSVNSAVFNNTAVDFVIADLPANVAVEYAVTLNGAPAAEIKNAGTYTVTATFTSTDPNYAIATADATKTAEFTVTPAIIDMSAVAFPSVQTGVYNTATHEFLVENLPDNVDATYTIVANGDISDEDLMKVVGTYTVSVTFISMDPNYKIADEYVLAPATYTITPAKISIEGVTFEGAEYYVTQLENLDGGRVTVAVGGSFSDTLVTVRYEIALAGGEFAEGNSATEIGVYTVKAYLVAVDADNYVLDGETVYETTITIKALEQFNMEDVSLNENYTVNFGDINVTDLETLITLNGTLPEGVLVDSIVISQGDDEYDLAQLVVGTYKVTVNFAKAGDLAYEFYAVPASLEAELIVTAKQINVAALGVGAASDWNYANHENYNAEEEAIEYADGLSIEMTLTAEAEAKLTEAGLTVTYKTYLIKAGEEPAEVDGPVTARGTYKTVAILAAIDNHEIADPETEITLVQWGVFSEAWTPAV